MTVASLPSILLVILDGLADRPQPDLNGLTPLEAAHTPNLDQLVAGGAAGFHYPLGPGRIPSSELVHFQFFGYGGNLFPGRACLEALGRGIPLKYGDVVTFLALRLCERTVDGNYKVISRYGEDVDGAEAAYRQLDGWQDKVTGFTFHVAPQPKGEAILVIRQGNAPETPWGDITDSDPFFFTQLPVLRPRALAASSRPQASAGTAEALGRFLDYGARVVANVTEGSGRADGAVSRLIVSKWTGTYQPLPTFTDLTGMAGAIVASTAVYRGFAELLGLTFVERPEDDDPQQELSAKLAAGLSLLEQGLEFVHIHTKAADEAAHNGDPAYKVAVIEALDRALEPLLTLDMSRFVVCITADHATAVGGRTVHWGDSVPVLLRGPYVRVDDVRRFGERSVVGGSLGQLTAADLLPVLLCHADRGHFQGARPVPFTTLGVPAIRQNSVGNNVSLV